MSDFLTRANRALTIQIPALDQNTKLTLLSDSVPVLATPAAVAAAAIGVIAGVGAGAAGYAAEEAADG